MVYLKFQFWWEKNVESLLNKSCGNLNRYNNGFASSIQMQWRLMGVFFGIAN